MEDELKRELEREQRAVEEQLADILAENIEQLKALFPETVTEGKTGFDVLKQLLGGAVDIAVALCSWNICTGHLLLPRIVEFCFPTGKQAFKYKCS